MKKIAFILPNLGGGGAEKAVVTLAEHLTTLGHEVHLILLANKIAYTHAASFQIHVLSQTGKLTHQKMLDKYLLAYRLKRCITRLSRNNKPFDFIAAHLLDASVIARLANITPCFHVIHSPLSQLLHELKDKKRKKHRRLRRIEHTYRDQELICISHGIASDIEENMNIFQKRLHMIHNPFPIKKIKQLAKAVPAVDLPSEPFILYVGRYSAVKRIDILLSAYAQLNAEHKLVLLTPPVAPLQKLIQQFNLTNRVHLPGFQQNPYPWFSAADLLVLSSDREGLPNVIVESLICGTPVVSTACSGGPAEVLGDHLEEWIVPCGNSEALSNKIAHALATRIDVSSFDESKFDVETVAKQYLALIG